MLNGQSYIFQTLTSKRRKYTKINQEKQETRLKVNAEQKTEAHSPTIDASTIFETHHSYLYKCTYYFNVLTHILTFSFEFIFFFFFGFPEGCPNSVCSSGAFFSFLTHFPHTLQESILYFWSPSYIFNFYRSKTITGKNSLKSDVCNYIFVLSIFRIINVRNRIWWLYDLLLFRIKRL